MIIPILRCIPRSPSCLPIASTTLSCEHCLVQLRTSLKLMSHLRLVWDIPTMGQFLTTVGVQMVVASLWVIISVAVVLVSGWVLSWEPFNFRGRLSLEERKRSIMIVDAALYRAMGTCASLCGLHWPFRREPHYCIHPGKIQVVAESPRRRQTAWTP
jgi:hypothetical protein